MSHPLPEPVVEVIAARFRVLGEPTRIRLLELLRDGDATVQGLTEHTEAKEQTVSKHLRVLHGAGIVSRRKNGGRVVYSIADPTVFELCETVCGGLARQFAELDELLGSGAERTPAERSGGGLSFSDIPQKWYRGRLASQGPAGRRSSSIPGDDGKRRLRPLPRHGIQPPRQPRAG